MNSREKKALLAKIEAHKKAIIKHRDELREILSCFEDIVESLESGIEEFDVAIRGIEDGIDRLSEYL